MTGDRKRFLHFERLRNFLTDRPYEPPILLTFQCNVMTSINRLRTAAVATALLFSTTFLHAEEGQKPEGLKLGISFGVATPSDRIAEVYQFPRTIDSLSYTYDVASSLGMHLGARFRLGMSENLSFSGGVAFNRFPDQQQTAVLSDGRKIAVQTVTNIVPVHAGLTFLFMRSMLVPYASAELMYTYRSVALSSGRDVLTAIIAPEQEIEPRTSRFGASLAAGLEVNLGGFSPFFEVRYLFSNLIGRENGEPERNFLNVMVGIGF